MFISDSLTVNLVDVIRYERPGGRYPTGCRNYFALSFRLHSQSVFQYRYGRVAAADDDIVLVPAGVSYTSVTQGDQMIVVHFDLCNFVTDRILCFSPENAASFEVLFRQMLALWQKKEPGYKLKATAVFYEILASIKVQTDLENKMENRYELAAEYMRNNLGDSSLSMTRVANLFHVSSSLFRRDFQKRFGISPKQYLDQLRMEYAVVLLRSGYFSQTEIAQRCGYNDVKYFRTAFSRKYGVPMSRYRYHFHTKE